ncbi:MAG: hypothetical protein ACRDI0_13860 [Actinomycetota bacterium]
MEDTERDEPGDTSEEGAPEPAPDDKVERAEEEGDTEEKAKEQINKAFE